MLQAAVAMRFYSAVFSLLTYRLLFCSERQISIGCVLLVFLLSVSFTMLFTEDIASLSDLVGESIRYVVRYLQNVIHSFLAL